MKKIFALLLLLVLVMGALVACNQVSATEKKIRWNNNESWTYNISLADFDTSLTTTDGSYYRDVLYAGETSPYSGKADRIVPESLSGQYVVTLNVDGTSGLATVSAMQTINATYTKELGSDWSAFKEFIVSEEDASVTLQSVTETKSVFKNGTLQTPVSSYTKVNGFYIGKQHQSATKYEISTEYEVGEKKTIAKVTKDGETTETEIATTNIIDNNQVSTFVRSYDKTSASFQDSPSVMVFDPLTKTTRKLTFYYTASQNVLVNHTFSGATENTQVGTQLNRLDLLLDGLAFMTQVNLPDMTAKGLDQISAGEVLNTYFPKHTIYRFRVGYVSYELQNYLTDAMVSAIQVKAE